MTSVCNTSVGYFADTCSHFYLMVLQPLLQMRFNTWPHLVQLIHNRRVVCNDEECCAVLCEHRLHVVHLSRHGRFLSWQGCCKFSPSNGQAHVIDLFIFECLLNRFVRLLLLGQTGSRFFLLLSDGEAVNRPPASRSLLRGLCRRRTWSDARLMHVFGW